MSKKEEAGKLLKGIEEKLNDAIDNIKDLSDQIPSLQERKKEVEAASIFVMRVPDEVFEEYEDEIYPLILFDAEQAAKYIPLVPKLTDDNRRYIASGTTTDTSFSEITVTVAKIDPNAD
jgi:hypothetical protein